MFALSIQSRVLGLCAFGVLLALLYQSNSRLIKPTESTYSNAAHREVTRELVAAIRPRAEITDPASPDVNTLNSKQCSATRSLGALLDSLDAALRDMSVSHTGGNAPLSAAYEIDREQLARQTYDGRALCDATKELVQGGTKQLAGLQWREWAPKNAVDRFGNSQATVGTNWADKSDPWGDLPSCTFISSASNSLLYFDAHGREKICVPATGIALPVGMPVSPLLAPSGWRGMEISLRQSASKVARANGARLFVSEDNKLEVLGREIKQHPHVLSTIEADQQIAAQNIASCYTGESAACEASQINAAIGAPFYEQAAARMLGVVVLDIRSGEIQAIGSSHTRCYEQEYDGPGRDPDCPVLPTTPSRRSWMLENHALHTSAMPGSLVKPIAGLAMMMDPAYKRYLLSAGAAEFRDDIKRSVSANFHDRLFCKDKLFKDCPRAAHFARAAELLGWNQGCLTSHGCGRLNAATGTLQQNGDRAGFLSVRLGRAGIQSERSSEPGWSAIPQVFTPEWARACSQRGKRGWEKCPGGTGSAVDLLAEAWGQGNAQTTPLGMAAMFATLGAAANGDVDVKQPHLLRAILTQQQLSVTPSRAKVGVPMDAAQLIVSGMALSHTPGGTAHSACKDIYGSAQTCASIAWVAGKTGTPVFNHDSKTLTQRREHCDQVLSAIQLAKTEQREVIALQADWAHCVMAPYKWYAALVRSNGTNSGPWDKVVVVIAERNWNQKTGLVDTPGDQGINVAARAAFEFIRRVYPSSASAKAHG